MLQASDLFGLHSYDWLGRRSHLDMHNRPIHNLAEAVFRQAILDLYVLNKEPRTARGFLTAAAGPFYRRRMTWLRILNGGSPSSHLDKVLQRKVKAFDNMDRDKLLRLFHDNGVLRQAKYPGLYKRSNGVPNT